MLHLIKTNLNKIHTRIVEYEVKTLSFSKIINKYKPEMVRMDIEGYEWVLLSHIQNIPENVHLIDMEIHYGDLSKVRKSLENLKNNGFYKAIVIVNPSILTFPIYVLSKILGVQRSIDLINKISLIEEVKMCKYDYLFKKSINYVSINCLINKLRNFLSYTGEVQVIFERKY